MQAPPALVEQPARESEIGNRKSAILAVAIALALPTAAARAGEVSAQLSTRETFVGVPVRVDIVVANADRHEPPVFPALVDAEVRGGQSSTQQNISIIQGVQSVRRTVTYTYQIIPKHSGKLRIPPVTVEVDGEKRSISLGEIIVSESETEDLLYVELTADRKGYYVGEVVNATLEIWLRPYAQRDYRMSANDMFRRIDFENSSWGEFADQLKQDNFRYRSDIRRDSTGQERGYFVYTVDKQIVAGSAGPLQAGDIRIVVDYPVKLGRSRDMFSFFEDRMGVVQSRPISAGVTSQAVEIKPLPTDGQPLYFNGAVGRYTMDVSARPTEVHVGDPITLTITMRGEGRLDALSAPPLARLDALTDGFRVPDEPLAGDVQGNVKRFTQSIRARSPDVAAIPALPFAYFDPNTEKYVTVSSEPIPIRVEAAEGASTALLGDAGGDAPRAPRRLTDVGSGIVANYTGADTLLATHAFQPGWGSAAVALVSPMTFMLCWLTQRRAQRLRTDVAFARRRRAARTAMSAISAVNAQHDSSPNAATAGRLAEAVLRYVADRCNLPAGGLTRAEAIQKLQGHGIDSMLVHRVNELLSQCEQAAYAHLAAGDSAQLAADAERCINEMEQAWR